MSNPRPFDLIERLTTSLPLDPEKVGAILGTRLEHDAEEDTPVLTAYVQSAGVKDSPYELVELNVPDPVFGEGGGLLNVTFKSDEGIDAKAILERYGLKFQRDVPSPRYPPGLPASLNYEQPWGRLSLGITNDDAGRLVRFILKPKAPAEEPAAE